MEEFEASFTRRCKTEKVLWLQPRFELSYVITYMIHYLVTVYGISFYADAQFYCNEKL